MSTPSLLNIPYVIKAGTLYSQIPETGAGDFAVTRATSPANNLSTRVNSLGFIERVNDNVPRLDYPLGGAVNGCASLLVEPSAQNLALQSEAFNTTWGRTRINAFGSGSVANTTGTLDPYGTNLADYLQEDTSASDTHRMNQSIAVVSGTTYSMTCFLKSAERFQVGLYVFQGGVERYTIFNLASGTATATNATGGIENYGNGWYRCRTTFTATASGTLSPGIYLCDDSGNLAYTGTGTKGLYAFGFQFETGSIATSYIPTTTAAATRNVDQITVSDAVSGCIGQTEGTLYAEVDMRVIPQFIVPISIDVGTVDEYLILAANSDGAFRVVIKKSTGSQTQLIISSSNPVGVYKLALAYKNGDYALSINGATPLTSSDSTNYPTGTFSRVHLSLQAYGVGLCRTRAAALYTTRLTNAQLQALTTL